MDTWLAPGSSHEIDVPSYSEERLREYARDIHATSTLQDSECGKILVLRPNPNATLRMGGLAFSRFLHGDLTGCRTGNGGKLSSS